jgi:hypothetical protein
MADATTRYPVRRVVVVSRSRLRLLTHTVRNGPWKQPGPRVVKLSSGSPVHGRSLSWIVTNSTTYVGASVPVYVVFRIQCYTFFYINQQQRSKRTHTLRVANHTHSFIHSLRSLQYQKQSWLTNVTKSIAAAAS